MPVIIRQDDLHCTEGSSNKTYHLALIDNENGTYTCATAHAGLGRSLIYGFKGKNTAMSVCVKEYNKQYNKEIGKGYVSSPGIRGNVFAHLLSSAPPASMPVVAAPVTATPDPVEGNEQVGIEVQLLTLVDDKKIPMFLTSPQYGAIVEHNGERRVTVLDAEFFMVNRRGFKVPCPSKVASVLGKTGLSSMKVDGKLIGDHFYAFDLLEVNGDDYKKKPYFSRYRTLTKLFSTVECENFSIIPLAISCFEKTSLYEKLSTEEQDGIVFVPLASTYVPGKSESGGPMLKRFISSSKPF